VLTKVFNLSNVYDTSYMLWYTREASVAVYVANLPLIWPLLREWFPLLRNATTTHSTPLPTTEPARSGRILQGRIVSMDAYHKDSNGITLTRTLTCESSPKTPDVCHSSPDEKETTNHSVSTSARRSISRGRTRTKSLDPELESHASITPRGTRRFSGESHWNDFISAETAVQIDEHQFGDFMNDSRAENRSISMLYSSPTQHSEADYERRPNSQITIWPYSFAGDRRSQRLVDSPPMPSSPTPRGRNFYRNATPSILS
jgi:hypothetical protein